ncbi:MAG: heme exporter protein CcmD [Xanthomonadaceae bacterium]|nr:heme exporter protein CcmD [Xanthomonadaceae bacterium]MDE2053140.1 heme exporter protein CcmD [Xanthomonadaceae bacterium]
MAHWLAMGGYAIYVWPAYAVFLAVLAWDWFAPALRRRRITRELRGRLARERTRNARAERVEAST